MSTNSLADHSFDSMPLWATGRICLRIEGPSRGYVEIASPYAVIGRSSSCDVILDDLSVASHHVYLHLSSQGLFGVDLLSGNGSHIGPKKQLSAWINSGEEILIGPWRIVVDRMILDSPIVQRYDGSDPLADLVNHDLCEITISPESGPPLVLHSELVFAGSANACGIQLHDSLAEHVHCVLVRSKAAVYLVDLAKRDVAINGEWIHSPVIIEDGDVISICDTRIKCHVTPHTNTWLSPLRPTSVEYPGRHHQVGITECVSSWTPNDSLFPETQSEVIAWLFRILQITQGDLLRRQYDFQQEVLQVLSEVQDNQSKDILRSMEKIDALQRELAGFRDEARSWTRSLEIGRRTEPSHLTQSRTPSGKAEPADDGMTAAWLMRRIQQINQELGSEVRSRIKGTQ